MGLRYSKTKLPAVVARHIFGDIGTDDGTTRKTTGMYRQWAGGDMGGGVGLGRDGGRRGFLNL